MRINDLAIPLGSTVVVIGANGFIGVETCEKLLQAGYRVRGTVRDLNKHRGWMHKLFDERWPGKFELVCVVDFIVDGAFDQAFEGAAGVVYVSTPIIFDPDPAKSVDPVVTGTINTLKAAAKAKVQRYVLSSSSKAVEGTVYNQPHIITADTFNYKDLWKAREEPPVATFEWSLSVYSAGRAAAELAFWAWVDENNPPFIANCVVLDGNFGRVINTENVSKVTQSSYGMLKSALAGEWAGVFPHLSYIIDVEDSARLLVAATCLASLANDRIFGYYKQATWNDLRDKVRQLYPDRSDLVVGEDQNLTGRDLSNADELIKRSEEVLKEFGRLGFTSIETMLCNFVDTFCPQAK